MTDKSQTTVRRWLPRTKLFLDREGIWFWCGGYGFLFRRNATNREYYSERNRIRCRVFYLGPMRLTLAWPDPVKELLHAD